MFKTFESAMLALVFTLAAIVLVLDLFVWRAV